MRCPLLPSGWPASLVAAARLGLRALLSTRASACCWDPARTGTKSLALPAQRSLTCTHKNRTEKGPNKTNTGQRIESNQPLRGQEEGRASFPMDPKFNSTSKNSNPRRGKKGNQKNKKLNRRGATGTCEPQELAALLSPFNPTNSLD